MDMELKQKAQNAGIDVNAGVERFMGNEELYEKFLRRFAEDASYQELVAAIASGDCQAAFTAAHTLKGVSGNLSLKKLEAVVAVQVEHLRAGDLDSARPLMEEITAAYEKVRAVIC